MGAIKNNKRMFCFTTSNKVGIMMCNENCSDYDILLMCELIYKIDPLNKFFSFERMNEDDIINCMDIPIISTHRHIYSDGGIIECRIFKMKTEV